MTYRTIEEAKQWIRDEHETAVEFARKNNLSYITLQRVLQGKTKCQYGEGRKIAEMLNLDIKQFQIPTQEKTPN